MVVLYKKNKMYLAIAPVACSMIMLLLDGLMTVYLHLAVFDNRMLN